MQITHMRCGAAGRFGAAVLAGKSPINPDLQADAPGCRTSGANSTHPLEGGSFDPEAIALMLAVLDEAWASRRAGASRSTMARRVLALVARGERDRARLCAYALGDVEPRDRFLLVRTASSKMTEVVRRQS
jgi:hypothetical protein